MYSLCPVQHWLSLFKVKKLQFRIFTLSIMKTCPLLYMSGSASKTLHEWTGQTAEQKVFSLCVSPLQSACWGCLSGELDRNFSKKTWRNSKWLMERRWSRSVVWNPVRLCIMCRLTHTFSSDISFVCTCVCVCVVSAGHSGCLVQHHDGTLPNRRLRHPRVWRIGGCSVCVFTQRMLVTPCVCALSTDAADFLTDCMCIESDIFVSTCPSFFFPR